METTRRARLFGVTWIVTTFVLAAVALPASGAEPAPDTAATGAGQSSPCLALLKAAAGKAGVRGTPTNIDDTDYGDGFYTCHIQYVVSAENGSDDLAAAQQQSADRGVVVRVRASGRVGINHVPRLQRRDVLLQERDPHGQRPGVHL
ncbi:MAG: hypothetical protein MUE60_16340 [Candidatus Eisenbacteria bacterium]|nr:hypothetical protein [Candidatus Eisenbacteria bacterium]